MENRENYFIKNTDELNHSTSVPLSCCDVYISSITNLDSLKYFNTITKLKLCALDSLEFNTDQIIDTTNISYLTNLADLFIENDDHIESLDLSNLSNLKSLFISSCHLLKNITGLENLDKLEELVIYDVPNIDKSFYYSLIKLIENHKLSKIVLDIYSYTLFTDEQLNYLKEQNVCFSEKIGFRDNYIYSFKMMEEYNNKIIDAYNRIHAESKTRDEVLYNIYKYVKNVNYDDDSLEKRKQYIEEGGKFHKFDNKYKSINSSYKALMKNTAVCEGYVNLLRYFYKLENIDLYPVFCEIDNSSHVAGKAFIDGTELYFDPEIDHRFNSDDNFMINKNDFSKIHNMYFIRDNFDIIYSSNNKVRE